MVKDKFQEATITVTGHSLGGGLAEVVSQMFRFSGATFDPVGTANVASSNAFHNIAQKYGIASTGNGVPADFTNYLVDGSPISGTPLLTNDHLGNTETFQVGDWIESLSHFPDSLRNEILTIFTAGTYLALDYVLFKHEMLGILEFMRQKEEDGRINYAGTSKANTLAANNFSNVIDGYDGNDTISGNGGNDTIDGGSGTDKALFSGNFADYTITLDKNSLVFTVTDRVAGRDGADQLTHVELFAFADGTWQAGDACTVVNGSYRNEYLYGNDLDNQLLGGAGNDVLEGKNGNDTMNGGSGTDAVIFTGNYADYTITRNADQTGYVITDQIGGRDGTDLVINVEEYRFADGVRDVAHLIDGGGGGTGGGETTASANRVSSSTKLFPAHTMGEWSNGYAFAAIREDGSVVTWGESDRGGNSSAVASQLNGDVDVVQVFSAPGAFAALREDGSVVTWGNSWKGLCYWAEDSVQVFSTRYAFAAIREDGAVVTWGPSDYGGNSSAVANKLNGDVNVVQVFSAESAFAALREDGSVVTWGDSAGGGNSDAVTDKLNGDVDVVQVFSTHGAFAALREDGSVVTWGSSYDGGDSSVVANQLHDVVQVFSSHSAFAALREDGSVVTWGSSYDGGDSSIVANELDGDVDVVQVFSAQSAFAALRKDGSVVTWGDRYGGGRGNNSSKLNGDIDVVQVFSAYYAFAALREDGSVVTWGISYAGGDSSAVSDKLNGDVDVVQVFSTSWAFAALRADGSVVTWGFGEWGGDSSVWYVVNNIDGGYSYTNSVANELHDVVGISDIYSNGSQDYIFTGTDANDNLTGSYASDILWGNSGNDILAAMGGNDLAFGGNGNDVFIGGEGEGDDTYVGGEGVDSVKYPSALAGITVNLAEGAAYSTDGNDAAAIGTDVLLNIEHIIAGNFDDLLIGNNAANSIEGGSGNDTLFGGEGADTLDGGDGSDTADYSDKTVAITVTLNESLDTIVTVGEVAEDTIRNIENLIGGSGNDVFTGNSVNNIFTGGAGNDTLDGGAGSDTADYSDKTEALSVTLKSSTDSLVTVGGVTEDTIRNIENLIGGSGNDMFTGDANANNLSGGEGDDTLQGGAGNDTLNGGFDDDTVLFSGNLAEYSISYNFTNAAYTVTDLIADRDGSDLISGVEFFNFADDGVHPVADLLDIVPPYLQAITPSAYATYISAGTNITLTFTEPVKPSTGNIVITNGSDTRTIDVTDTTQVTFNGNTVIINPTNDLQAGTSYHVAIENDAMTDEAGNPFAGTSDYTFTTESASLPRHTLSGGVTFWKDTLPLSHVELQTTSVIPTTPEVEFKNLQLHTDGTRTVELWVNSPSSTVQSIQVELELQAGSIATWQNAATMPSSWTTLTNSSPNGHFVIGSVGLNALATASMQLGTITLSAPTDTSRFELAMLAGTIDGAQLTPYSATSSGVTTGAEGDYNFNELMESTYTLQANKESASLSNAITAADALAALKMAVGLNPNDADAVVLPYQFLAADINHDGKIRATDALNILKMAVGLSTAPEEEWIFVYGAITRYRQTFQTVPLTLVPLKG